MGLTLDQFLNIRGVQRLQDAKRKLNFDSAPSQKVELKTEPNQFLSANGSTLGNSNLQLAPNLSLALTLSQNSRSVHNLKISDARTLMTPHGSINDPRVSSLLNLDEVNRTARTEGIGDRAFNVLNTTPVETPKLFPLSTTDSLNQNLITETSAQPQNETERVRGAILQIANHYFRNDQNPSSDDLKTAIDSVLGSGAADLFSVRIEDRGFGKSAIVVNQVDYNQLDDSQQTTFDNAAAAVDQFYGTQEDKRTLKGTDISEKLSELQSLLGVNGAAITTQLRNDLSKTTNVSDTLDQFYAQAQDLGLSTADQQSLESLVNDLKQLDQNVTSSFDQNAIVDDFSQEFTSKRYGAAFSPDEIDTVANLSADTIFLAK